MMLGMTFHSVRVSALGTVLATSLAACDRSPAPSAETAPRSNIRAVSNYRSINGSEPVAVVEDPARSAIDTAIAEARQSIDPARQRWAQADEAERRRWLVKWAGPLRADSSAENAPAEVEHVWVLPINWSAFRIEGVLISMPVAELDCGKNQNDLVSFTADELSDWVVLSAANPRVPEQGGFTIRSLEKAPAQ